MRSSYRTSVGGSLDGGGQLDTVIHSLSVADPTCLAALDSLLHQEAENITGVLGTCAVPLHTAEHTTATHEDSVINRDFQNVTIQKTLFLFSPQHWPVSEPLTCRPQGRNILVIVRSALLLLKRIEEENHFLKNTEKYILNNCFQFLMSRLKLIFSDQPNNLLRSKF